MELFIVTYQGGVVLAREVLHGLQPLESNKFEYIQVEFDLGGRELVSSCGKIKPFTRSCVPAITSALVYRVHDHRLTQADRVS